MGDDLNLKRLQSFKEAAEIRLKLAVGTARWADAAREAELLVDLEADIVAAKAAAVPQNVIPGRVRAQG